MEHQSGQNGRLQVGKNVRISEESLRLGSAPVLNGAELAQHRRKDVGYVYTAFFLKNDHFFLNPKTRGKILKTTPKP